MDLTKLTAPFGLLDAETQEALKAHGGPYLFWNWSRNDWLIRDSDPCFHTATVYRVKPAPPKPREFWVTYDTRGKVGVFDRPVHQNCGYEVIHVREVLPE